MRPRFSGWTVADLYQAAEKRQLAAALPIFALQKLDASVIQIHHRPCCHFEPALGAKNLHLPLSLGTHADPSLPLRMTVWDMGSPRRVSADHGQPNGRQCSE